MLLFYLKAALKYYFCTRQQIYKIKDYHDYYGTKPFKTHFCEI